MGSFLGMKMDQYWMDLFLWEKFLNTHTVRTIIELGTGYGGMSTFLKMQCAQRGMKFFTFDNITSNKFDSAVCVALGMAGDYKCLDLFSDAGRNLIKTLIDTNPHPLCMFFDDGDKPREWRTYQPFLSPGDFMAVHDWEVEFKAEHASGNVAMLQESEPRSGYKTAWFIKS